MRISVIICTWNRGELLKRTLASLTALVIPQGVDWELIVVNNGSVEATAAAIASFEQRLPVRQLVEPELGLSRARNTGVAGATGDLLLFTDDDVVADPEWLAAYVEAAGQWREAGFFGGYIFPVFDSGVPRWVRRHQEALDGMLCTLDLGTETRLFPTDKSPYGPNMAIRRSAMALTTFRTDVGRKGGGHIRGSETSVFRDLERQGICGVWVPQARVGHQIPASRASLRYLWNYYHGTGRGGARLDPAAIQWRRQVTRSLRAAGRLVTDPRRWPAHLAALAKETGRLRESSARR